jgi:beta-glucanase (GH16 family)
MAQKVNVRFLPRPSTGVAVIALLCAVATGWAAPAKRPPKPQPQGCSAWSDNFTSPTLNPQVWVVANGQAPGCIPGSHIGYYDPTHVSIQNGFLKIELTQQSGDVDGYNGTISYGGLVYTRAKCGYGTYEWTMRMSSTSGTPDGSGAWESGSVSAGFLYVNNSETEIDFEYSALSPEYVWAVNWLNTNPKLDPTGSMETATPVSMPDATAYPAHTYRFVWAARAITFYIDGVRVARHTTNVPSAPAYFMINHWGTDSPYWGGYATIGTPRYFYVDSVSYTPSK